MLRWLYQVIRASVSDAGIDTGPMLEFGTQVFNTLHENRVEGLDDEQTLKRIQMLADILIFETTEVDL